MPKEIPQEIRLENTPESRKAWRIAAMRYSANMLRTCGYSLENAAEFLEAMSAALKHGVPDGCHSFCEEDEEPEEIIIGEELQQA